MAKGRNKGSRKTHIKQAAFKDRNFSGIDHHPRSGRTLKSPFSVLSPAPTFSSWHDECIPNILWACILASLLPRDEYLQLFRFAVIDTRQKIERRAETFATHNYLSLMSDAEFDSMFERVLRHEGARACLRGLRLVECLPDRRHWQRVLDAPDPEKDWNILFHAVADTFDHHSERSTDVRWLKLMHFIVCREGMRFQPDQAEQLEEFRNYPNVGDMRAVRPSVRAAEMATRGFEFGKGLGVDSEDFKHLPDYHGPRFWAEMKEKTQCISPHEFLKPKRSPKDARDEILEIYSALDRHFHESATTTAPDARHDGAFGLVLNVMAQLLNVALGYSARSSEGRLVLRSIVEQFITLHFLLKSDDPKLWQQFRQYGVGQTKLAFLKNVREEDVPPFINLAFLEHLANEDAWMEFQDIELGHWAQLNLRKMSETAGIKDVYDKFYDWTSGYLHAHWGCIREAVFENCLNPLHRFHRIPCMPRYDMSDVLPDCFRIANRMLDDLNTLYPPFKLRFKWHNEPVQNNEQPAS